VLVNISTAFDDDDEELDDYSEDSDYERYEEECAKRVEENEEHLVFFESYLEKKGLTDKTIYRHLDNVRFYLNTFMLREDAYPMEEGCYRLDEFFGFFFIRKCLWSTSANIKTTAASLKKFYKCMLEAGRIAQASYDEVCETIKESMEEWQEACAMYNDPDSENPFGLWAL
jgi:hypothetical protein